MNGRLLPPMLLCLEPAAPPIHPWLEPLGHHFHLIEGNGRPAALGRTPYFLLGIGLACLSAQARAVRNPHSLAGLLLCAPAGLPDLEQCQAINIPALILAGRHHPSAQIAEHFHAALPHSHLVIFDGSGRFPFTDEPQNFERVIRDWLAIL